MGATAQHKPAVVSDDEWQQRATAAAIAAARGVVSKDGINGRAMISSLSEVEWGWIVAGAIFGWIETKAKQAVAEGTAIEVAIRTMARNPEPWEAGAVASVLPALGEIEGVDWAKPVGDWSKDQITGFAWQIYRLVDQAMARRDEGAVDKIVRFTRESAERENSAANGGGLLSHDELNDEIPF